MITQERLKHLLSYDMETGVFRHRKPPGRICRMKDGDIAGTVGGRVDHRYRKICADNEYYYAHHLAWLYVYGEWLDRIDHKDRDGLNNSISNLRPCTQSQNMINSVTTKPNMYGFRGVHYHRDRAKCYSSRITVNEETLYLGYFYTPEEAHLAYVKAAEKHFGEFADIHRRAIEESDEIASSGTLLASNH
jgi:hypothetical protein